MIKCNLKVMLAKRDLSQLDLSRKTGVRQPTISALCTNNAKHIPIDVLDKICEVLDCQPSDLFEHKSEL